MRRYGFTGSQNNVASPAVAGTDATGWLANITAANGGNRPHLYYFSVGTTASPTDATVGCGVRTYTGGNGTFTSVTPGLIDGAEGASDSGAGSNSTAAPTTLDILIWRRTWNQRSTVEWFEDPTLGIIVPAATNNGVGMHFTDNSGSATDEFVTTMHFSEV